MTLQQKRIAIGDRGVQTVCEQCTRQSPSPSPSRCPSRCPSQCARRKPDRTGQTFDPACGNSNCRCSGSESLRLVAVGWAISVEAIESTAAQPVQGDVSRTNRRRSWQDNRQSHRRSSGGTRAGRQRGRRARLASGGRYQRRDDRGRTVVNRPGRSQVWSGHQAGSQVTFRRSRFKAGLAAAQVFRQTDFPAQRLLLDRATECRGEAASQKSAQDQQLRISGSGTSCEARRSCGVRVPSSA